MSRARDSYEARALAAEAELAELRETYASLAAHHTALHEAAANVVAQWRGDISRKPFIGKLRDALRGSTSVPPTADGKERP